MPGSTPPTSQLDWLSSTTAMIVLSWSKATRDLLKSFSWGIGGTPSVICQRRWCHLLAACPIPSHRWRERDSNLRSPHHHSLGRTLTTFWIKPLKRSDIHRIGGHVIVPLRVTFRLFMIINGACMWLSCPNHGLHSASFCGSVTALSA